MKQKNERLFLSSIAIVYVLLVTLLATLLLASLSDTDPLSKSLGRWKVPVSEGESIEINNLNCIEKFITVVPENTKVNLISDAGPYWEQRFFEISFPRIYVVSEKSEITIYLVSAPTPIATTQCGSVFLGVDSDA